MKKRLPTLQSEVFFYPVIRFLTLLLLTLIFWHVIILIAKIGTQIIGVLRREPDAYPNRPPEVPALVGDP